MGSLLNDMRNSHIIAGNNGNFGGDMAGHGVGVRGHGNDTGIPLTSNISPICIQNTLPKPNKSYISGNRVNYGDGGNYGGSMNVEIDNGFQLNTKGTPVYNYGSLEFRQDSSNLKRRSDPIMEKYHLATKKPHYQMESNEHGIKNPLFNSIHTSLHLQPLHPPPNQ